MILREMTGDYIEANRGSFCEAFPKNSLDDLVRNQGRNGEWAQN
jgi:hypothetical protein